jgi:hypothetical protein
MTQTDIHLSDEGHTLINRALDAIKRTKYERLENKWRNEIGLIVILITAGVSLLTVIMATLTVSGRIHNMSSFFLIVTLAVPAVSFLVPLSSYLSYRKFSSEAAYFASLADDIEEKMREAINKPFSQNQ